MLHVVAIVTAKPGQRGALLAEFKKLLPLVRDEPGCIEYSATIDADGSSMGFGPDVFVVIEKWQDKAKLDAHSASVHMTRYATEAGHLIQSVKAYYLSEA
jgi:quinol monooxygenase YgiN